MLAQAAQTAPTVDTIWIVVIAIASVGANVATIIAVFTGRAKQKREVSFEFEPASKTEFDQHLVTNRHEHENLFSKIGGVERGVTERLEKKITAFAAEGQESREKMHARINRISIGVARLCGKLNVSMPAEDAEI